MRSIKSIYILSSALLAIYFVALGNWDFWDGVIVNYSYQIQDLTPLWRMFSDSNWYISCCIYTVIFYASKIASVPPGIFIHFVTWFLLIYLAFLVSNLTALCFELGKKEKLIVFIFTAFSPLLVISVSSIFITYLVFFCALCSALVCVKNFKDITKAKLLLLILNTIIFSQYYPLIPLFLVLVMLFASERSGTYSSKQKLKLLFICSLSVFVGIAWLFLVKPKGLYASYNAFNVNGDTFIAWIQTLSLVGTCYLLLSGCIVVAACLGLFSYSFRPWSLAGKDLRIYILILSGIVLSSIPHAIVGKFFSFDDYWTARYLMHYFLPFSFLFALMVKRVLSVPSMLNKKKSIFYYSLLLMPVLVFSLGGYTFFSARAYFEKKLSRQLSRLTTPQSGIALMQSDIVKYFGGYSVYESNWLLFKAFGKASWLSILGNVSPDSLCHLTNSVFSSPFFWCKVYADPVLRKNYILDSIDSAGKIYLISCNVFDLTRLSEIREAANPLCIFPKCLGQGIDSSTEGAMFIKQNTTKNEKIFIASPQSESYYKESQTLNFFESDFYSLALSTIATDTKTLLATGSQLSKLFYDVNSNDCALLNYIIKNYNITAASTSETMLLFTKDNKVQPNHQADESNILKSDDPACLAYFNMSNMPNKDPNKLSNLPPVSVTQSNFTIEIIAKPSANHSLHATILSNHYGDHFQGFSVEQASSDYHVFAFAFGNGKKWLPGVSFELKDRYNYIAISVVNNLITIYQDGVSVKFIDAGDIIKNSVLPLSIANWFIGDRPFIGELKEVRVLDRSLSLREFIDTSRRFYDVTSLLSD